MNKPAPLAVSEGSGGRESNGPDVFVVAGYLSRFWWLRGVIWRGVAADGRRRLCKDWGARYVCRNV